MKPIILFRKDYTTEEEFEIAKKYFTIEESRIPLKDKVVIGRYSVLPFYKELERDLLLLGSELVNSYRQHSYIANFDYYYDIEDLTPKTWFDFLDAEKKDGPFIVKGRTNSRKHQWKELMYAETKKDAVNIACDLRNDSLIGEQDIIFRKFEKLNIVDMGINGMPMANEWRFFCLDDKILSYGFYWSITEKRGEIDKDAFDLVWEVMQRVKEKVRFYVVDVAQKEDGSWIVIELNDGQMSGLSCNNPDHLYKNLYTYFN